MNEKYIFGLVVIATTIFATISISNLLVGSSGDSSTSLTYHTAVCVYKNGELVGPCRHNLVVNSGLNYLRDSLGSGTAGQKFVNLTLANCTGAQDPSDTTLCDGEDYDSSCGLGPADGTYVQATGNGAWNVTHEWTATCDELIVNATGLYNTSTMFAENTFTSVTLQTNDKINVTWGIWVTSG